MQSYLRCLQIIAACHAPSLGSCNIFIEGAVSASCKSIQGKPNIYHTLYGAGHWLRSRVLGHSAIREGPKTTASCWYRTFHSQDDRFWGWRVDCFQQVIAKSCMSIKPMHRFFTDMESILVW